MPSNLIQENGSHYKAIPSELRHGGSWRSSLPSPKGEVSYSACFWSPFFPLRVPLIAQRVKNLLAMQETQVRSLGQKDPLEKETTAHSSILAWRIPSTEKPGGLQSIGLQRVRHD